MGISDKIKEVTDKEDFDHKPDLIDAVGRLVFSIRWGLVPMYLLLWVAMISYNIHFAMEMVGFLVKFSPVFPFIWFPLNDGNEYLLWILSLIDITMIGNLVVMTTIGGFSTFVRAFDTTGRFRMPHWLVGLDSNTLKIKMGMSLVAVSAIHLLKTFMDTHQDANWDIVLQQCLIHVVFIFTTVAFTMNARLMPKKAAHGTPQELLTAPPKANGH